MSETTNTGDCNTGYWNTGNRNTGYWNTGNRNTGYWNTGNRNTGNWNTGDCNTGNRNTGNWNTGYWNTGDCNTGNRNTGDCNTGNRNTGNWNTGDCNTGNRNTGNWNTGYWNTGDCNTGYFNIGTPDTVRVFGSEISRDIWEECEKPSFLFFSINKWVSESEMTEQEKTEHPEAHTTGGYLKEYEYQEAFRNSYYSLSEGERETQTEQLKALPNFNAEMFKEISGIDITESHTREMTVAEISEALGCEIRVVK